MPARRKAVAVAAVGIAPLALTALSTAPASAHGSMGDPVSRVAQCYAEGPESPTSDACKAAVAAGGTQALYDWNGVRIGNAAGQHRTLIPDGKLCSANNEAFKGLDLARADWPATSVSSGSHTFKYRVTAPHKGTFTVYLTKPGYDPAQPLGWDDLDLANPVATATDPAASGGFYTFSGSLPERSGKHVLYAIWQRSDSPEAFYSCSDVTFGGSGNGGSGSNDNTGDSDSNDSDGNDDSSNNESGNNNGSTPPVSAPTASAPTDEQIEAAAENSTIENHGHGDNDPGTSAAPDAPTANQPKAAAAGTSENLAETGGDSSTTYLAVGGAAALALGSAALFASVRRRAARGGRHGR
ncbi:chitin-binding protein [Streptomyces spinoverrucosus]|uniref:Chitin-binding protein n=1 Tax=Streptomyces spinoverrucosus TaxID=284043 RepID=A0A4Y3VIJ7_9ACTN|nr:lytic polysaccharide monooxygenase [Streptomyces spinoverrucosus]GEC06677.1 chitin-binding protein [Streptomyces spinoverrucosus]GHB56291.1 chitin-binding protein [Streptomyces spinoverrucosus]